MSKFFNETQRANESASGVADPVRLDVVSAIDAIKHGETLATNPVDTGLPPNDQELQVHSGAKRLISTVGRAVVTDAATEAYRTLRTRVMRLQASKGMRSIMLTSAVPSEGKTMTALNLALSCAQLQDLRILLVDADLRSQGLTRLLQIPSGRGLSDVLSESCEPDEGMLSTDRSNLFVFGAGTSNGQPAELFASPRWLEFTNWAKQGFDITVVDATPVHSLADAELIGAGCDGILFLVRACSTPREMAQKCLARLDKKKLIGTAVNGLPISPDRYSYYGVADGQYGRNKNGR
jgi:protein-tyrosine kinase